MGKTIQFRCTLLGTKPIIWRQFAVDEDYRMDSFHQIIQIVMGWKDAHLHEFNYMDRRIGMQLEDGFDMDNLEDETKIHLKDLNLKPGQIFNYEYDFGDCWEHELQVLSISPKTIESPICINGAMSCPPEDCGGIPGYKDLVKVSRNPSDPEYASYFQWLGYHFDPKLFSMNTVNNELQEFAKFGNADYKKEKTTWNPSIPPEQSEAPYLEPIEISMKEYSSNDITYQDTKPIAAIDNLSKLDMQNILYSTFQPTSPVGFKENVPQDIYSKIPFSNLVLAFLERLEKVGELKLTKKSNLPTQWCIDLYNLRFILEPMIENGIMKLYKEKSSLTIQHLKIICDLASLTKKRKNKLSLTTKGKALLNTDNKEEIFKCLYLTNLMEMNLGYYDGWKENIGIQETFGYTLYLLLKYGKKELPLDFYADKNIKAFPMLLIPFDRNRDRDIYMTCYHSRIFRRFLNLYGLIIQKGEYSYDTKNITIKTSDLFNKIFEIKNENFSFAKSKFES